MRNLLLLSVAMGCLFLQGRTQDVGILQQLPEEEQGAIEAIALYPETERTAVLEASMHPEVLVRIELVRQSTESAFRDLLADIPEDDQKRIYNVTRYPELIETMGAGDYQRSRQEMRELLKGFPPEIHDDATYVNREYPLLSGDVHRLYTDSERAFERILSQYAGNIQDAYRELVALPEVLSLLTDNMQMTILLGDIYRSHPEELLHELDSLNAIVAEEQTRELNAWKQDLEENPEAMYEYEQAAKEFAAEQGYDDEVYSGPLPEEYSRDVYVHHVWRPYPYWFGWPRWYTYESWYPYPWWYHWGYYYGPRNVIVIVGLPSRSFVHWHFYNHRHLYSYPHFTNRVIDHYYGPRGYDSGLGAVVRRWENDHRAELPQDWFRNDGRRVERIREYGKFRMDYENTVRETGGTTPTPRQFLKENADKYATLQPVLRERPETEKAEPRPPRIYTPPRTDTRDRYRPREPVIEKGKVPREEEIDRAKQRHESIWDRLKDARRRQRPPAHTQPSGRDPAPPRAEPSKRAPSKKPGQTAPRRDRRKTQPKQSQPRKI